MDRRSFLKYAASGLVLAGSYPLLAAGLVARVNRYRIPLPGLPRSFEGFTIVQLTDIHYGSLVSLDQIGAIIDRANAIPRDITVCTGDYINRTTREADAVWPLLCRLTAPSGVYSVLGNHDHNGDPRHSIRWLERSGQSLRHAVRRIERNGESLWLVGAGDYESDHVDIDGLMASTPQTDCRIVLAHNPDSADTITGATPDLLIAGHTHGGQVALPLVGSPFLSVHNRAYSQGLVHSRRGFPLFICRGIGWTRIPIRINCPPEIAVLELTGSKALAA